MIWANIHNLQGIGPYKLSISLGKEIMSTALSIGSQDNSFNFENLFRQDSIWWRDKTENILG